MCLRVLLCSKSCDSETDVSASLLEPDSVQKYVSDININAENADIIKKNKPHCHNILAFHYLYIW